MKKWKRMLAFDPGSTNFGVALVDMSSTGQVRPVKTSLLKSPIKNLAHDLPTQVQKFVLEIDEWMALGPDGWIAERFQSRGLRGSTVECVTLMCGVLIQTYDMPYKLVTAATWKNAQNRRLAQGGTPFENLKDVYGWTKVQPHQLDAALIAVYGLGLGTGVRPRYRLVSFVEQLEQCSTEKLVNRKIRQ